MYKIDLYTILFKEHKHWLYKLENQHPNNKELLKIFNLTEIQEKQNKIRYHKSHKQRVVATLNQLDIEALNITDPLAIHLNGQQQVYGNKVLNKLTNTIKFINKRIKYLKEVKIAEREGTPAPPQPEYTEYDIEHIKKNTPIELVMGSSPVKTTHGGKKWYLCPLHNEKTPSFLWNDAPEDKYFKCQGCGQGGDIITLYQKLNGTSFVETLKLLS